jgi:hypothetical protein
MSTHTQGPWEAEVIGNKYDIIGDRDQFGLARVLVAQNVHQRDVPLIQSAPDLLAVVKLFLAAGLGNSTDFEKQSEAHRTAWKILNRKVGES